MELGNALVSWRGEFSRGSAEILLGVFFAFWGGLCVFLGVFSRCAAIDFARSANVFLGSFSFFLNGAEQNGGLPPCQNPRKWPANQDPRVSGQRAHGGECQTRAMG